MRFEILGRKSKTVEMKILLELFNRFEKIRGNHVTLRYYIYINQMAKVLALQVQNQSFQKPFRIDFS